MNKRDPKTGKMLKTHGMANTRIYSIWSGIKNRCYNKNKREYRLYGAKGITMCEEWKNDFMCFYNWSMANGYSDSLSIDRVDNNKGYTPDNCRWADNMTQTLNRSITKYVEVNGKFYTIPQLSKLYNININCLYARAKKYGYTEEILKAYHRKYKYKGENYTLTELADKVGLSIQAVAYRIKRGWNMDDIGKPKQK